MTAVALDTSSLATWVLQERGWHAIDAVMGRVDDLVLPGPVLTELVELVRRKGNQATGRETFDTLKAQGAKIEHPKDGDLLRAAELLEVSKAHPGPDGETLSLGDCLVLAITERLALPVITRDVYWELFAADGHTTVRVQTF